MPPAPLAGSFDGIFLVTEHCAARGWASIVPEFTGPALAIKIARSNGTTLATGTANISRAVAGDHGFVADFPCADIIVRGFSAIHAYAQHPASSAWIEIPHSPHCTFDGEPFNCSAPRPPTPSGPTPAPLPGQVCSFDLVNGAGDCAQMNGRFVCNANGVWRPNALTGQGAFGYCRRSPVVDSSAMRCCRLPDPAHKDLPPSPTVIAPTYPTVPSKRDTSKPNIVLFLTDDEDVELGSLHAMNRTTALLRDGGATLAGHRVTTPICCPSRITLLSGRYAHHAGVNYSNTSGWCSNGVYWKGPLQHQALPTYIQAAGYTTGIFGKETNANDATTISPGWDRFFVLGGTSEGHYYSDWFADQGTRFNASGEEYMTDLIANRSLAWMETQLEAKRPFFAYIAPHAPHTRATPAPGTDGYFVDEQAPRKPSWNASASDKHWMVAEQEPLTALCASASDELYRNRLRALLGVDQLVGEVADLLMKHNQLDSTYILYTSDHGFHLGEFRMPYFKGQPYEFDLRVPMMIRGPGIAPGSTIPQLTLHIDLAPTIAALAGTVPPPAADVDGASLTPLLFAKSTAEEETAVLPWRTDMLFEFWCGGNAASTPPRGGYCHHIICSYNNTYAGILTETGLKLVQFEDDVNFVEFYDLKKDPHELRNAAGDPGVAGDVVRLQKRLKELRNCAGAACRAPAEVVGEGDSWRSTAT